VPKNATLSTFASTATSKKPTIISSQLCSPIAPLLSDPGCEDCWPSCRNSRSTPASCLSAAVSASSVDNSSARRSRTASPAAAFPVCRRNRRTRIQRRSAQVHVREHADQQRVARHHAGHRCVIIARARRNHDVAILHLQCQHALRGPLFQEVDADRSAVARSRLLRRVVQLQHQVRTRREFFTHPLRPHGGRTAGV